MPLIFPSSYSAPKILRNPHIHSFLAGQLRKFDDVHYQRERINTHDGDFLDLDWSNIGCKKLVILAHGLEGSTNRTYMLGMVRAFNMNGYDALAWNNRGCGGEVNRHAKTYHCGTTEDLHRVIEHALSCKKYDTIVLIGFSLGGSITLKYVGEQKENIHPNIKAAVAFSVPVDIAPCTTKLSSSNKRFYFHLFMKTFRRKFQLKHEVNPSDINMKDFTSLKTWKNFDDLFTARYFGFKSAEDYWENASCKKHLQHIKIPTLLINAEDDPLLSAECFPRRLAAKHDTFFLETPKEGSHVGFISFDCDNNQYWSEKRAVEFVNSHVK